MFNFPEEQALCAYKFGVRGVSYLLECGTPRTGLTYFGLRLVSCRFGMRRVPRRFGMRYGSYLPHSYTFTRPRFNRHRSAHDSPFPYGKRFQHIFCNMFVNVKLSIKDNSHSDKNIKINHGGCCQAYISGYLNLSLFYRSWHHVKDLPIIPNFIPSVST